MRRVDTATGILPISRALFANTLGNTGIELESTAVLSLEIKEARSFSLAKPFGCEPRGNHRLCRLATAYCIRRSDQQKSHQKLFSSER